MRQNAINFFEGISRYLWSLSDVNGALFCPKHRIEHTGTNAYSIIIDLWLHARTGEEKYFSRACTRAQRVSNRAVKNPENNSYIFWPSHLGARNMSNAVIDSGEAADALAALLSAAEGRIRNEARARIEDAVIKNADTYLARAVTTKELPDQRLWGAAGLAAAFGIWKRPEWKRACLRSIAMTLDRQWSDGTLPYHPQWRDFALSPSMEELTAFYHSRQIGFIFFVLERLGESAEPYRDALSRAGEVLMALYTPQGKKLMALETKRWYWFGQYEVAGSGFDLYALIKLWELTHDPRYRAMAAAAWQILRDHVLPDGGIASHHGAPYEFQCRVFWNAHLAWLTRVIDRIPECADDTPAADAWRAFADNGVVRFDSPSLVAVWRGRKRPCDTLYGPPVGGGSLLYFGRKNSDWKNIMEFNEWQERVPLNFWFRKGHGWSIASFIRMIKRERQNLRALAYYLWIEIFAGNGSGIARRLADMAKKLWSGGRDIYSSAWATEVHMQRFDDTLTFALHPAMRNGTPLAGVTITRAYLRDGDELRVQETVTSNDPRIRGAWIPIPAAREVRGATCYQGKGVWKISYRL